MSNKERAIANKYAKSKGISLSEATKRTFFDTIEEESDLVEAKAVSKKIRNGVEATYFVDEVYKLLCM